MRRGILLMLSAACGQGSSPGESEPVEAAPRAITPSRIQVLERRACEPRQRLEVHREPTPWEGRRIAGVDAFGFGGTNAHAILEAFTDSGDVAAPSRWSPGVEIAGCAARIGGWTGAELGRGSRSDPMPSSFADGTKSVSRPLSRPGTGARSGGRREAS